MKEGTKFAAHDFQTRVGLGIIMLLEKVCPQDVTWKFKSSALLKMVTVGGLSQFQ